MYIFQPDRILLKQQVARVAHYVRGAVIDIGAGPFDRYSHLFAYDSYTKTDILPHPSVEVACTAEAIPVADETFDSAVSTQVYQCFADPLPAAQEMYRVLRQGGYAIVTVPQMNELTKEPYDCLRFTCYGIAALFERVGFTVVDMHQRGGYYATIAQMGLMVFLGGCFRLSRQNC